MRPDDTTYALPYWSTARSFRSSVGLAPHAYVMRRRILRAQELLASTELPLADIAIATGFADQSHFCRRFRDMTGVPPRTFRFNIDNLRRRRGTNAPSFVFRAD